MYNKHTFMNNSPICTTEYYCQFSYVYFYRNTTVKFIQQESFHFLDGRRLRQLLQNHNKRKNNLFAKRTQIF